MANDESVEKLWPVGVEKKGRLTLAEDAGGYQGEVGLACPVCGNLYMHIEGVDQEQGAHDRWIGLRLSGECGHRVTTTLTEHKGALFVTTRRETDFA